MACERCAGAPVQPLLPRPAVSVVHRWTSGRAGRSGRTKARRRAYRPVFAVGRAGLDERSEDGCRHGAGSPLGLTSGTSPPRQNQPGPRHVRPAELYAPARRPARGRHPLAAEPSAGAGGTGPASPMAHLAMVAISPMMLVEHAEDPLDADQEFRGRDVPVAARGLSLPLPGFSAGPTRFVVAPLFDSRGITSAASASRDIAPGEEASHVVRADAGLEPRVDLVLVGDHGSPPRPSGAGAPTSTTEPMKASVSWSSPPSRTRPSSVASPT